LSSPDVVSLQPGLLTVVFDNEPQLLERLFPLARVFATMAQWFEYSSIAGSRFPRKSCGNNGLSQECVWVLAGLECGDNSQVIDSALVRSHYLVEPTNAV
jgi:hypothetical protein